MPALAEQNSTRPATKLLPLAPLPLKGRGKRRRIARWIYSIAATVAAFVGWEVWSAHVQSQIKFETAPVERGSIESAITATGNLNPVVNVQVGSQVSGNIKALYADFNTKVKEGQLVALIDPQIFQAQVDQASGAEASAAAAVVAADAQVQRAKADLAGAIASRDNLKSVLAKDRANALNAEIQWKRGDALFKDGVVSEQDHDTARATLDSYEAQLTADQSQIDAAEHNIQSAQAQVNVAITNLSASRAQQRQAQAALRQATINLEHTRIVAPVSGTVIARHFDVGQTVAASFQAPDIFDIAQDLTQMQVDTNVDESDVGAIRIGQPATFTVDAYAGMTFHGNVTDVRKAPIVAQNVVTYDVVIQVANPDLKLFPGMTANVNILTSRQEDVLKIPNAALRFHPTADLLKKGGLAAPKAGTQQVYVLSGNKMKVVPVKLGISDARFTAASSSDLKPGDLLVIRATTAGTAPTAPSSAPVGGARRVGV